jgi:hypothetical protein
MATETNPPSPFYVSGIQSDRLWIRRLDATIGEPDPSFEAMPSWRSTALWYVLFGSRDHLPDLLMKLRDKGLAFLNEPKGWPPAAIFEKLHHEGKVTGDYATITFFAPGAYQISQPHAHPNGDDRE